MPDDWIRAELTQPKQALQLTGDRAVELGVARHAVETFDEPSSNMVWRGTFGWPNRATGGLPRAGTRLPAVAWLLLFIGEAALYAEINHQALALGFHCRRIVPSLFWSRRPGGTADWLEVELFVAGVCCVLVEIFVLPGCRGLRARRWVVDYRLAGLASQTFIIPIAQIS